MSIIYQISLGVRELRCDLTCVEKPNTKAQLILNFEVEGNFMGAAKNDDLSQTVDYDLLSQKLCTCAAQFTCHDAAHIQSHMATVIKNFSPLISGGFLYSRLLCHTVFQNECTLL